MRSLIAYAGCIVAANVALATVGFVPLGFGLVAPAGVLFAGLSFTARDFVHEHYGSAGALAAVIAGAALSYLVAPSFALASGAAFLVAELLDLGVYAPLRQRHWLAAVAASNVVGFLADSALFLWLAFGSLDFLAGQLVGKGYMTAAAVVVLWWMRRRAVSIEHA